MSNASAPRALKPFRLFISASALTLGWIIFGTQSAVADGSTPEQPVLGGLVSSSSTEPIRVTVAATVGVVDPSKAAAGTASAKAGAVVRPRPAAPKPVTSIANQVSKLPAVKQVTSTKPISQVTNLVTDRVSKLPAVKQVTSPKPISQVTNLVTDQVGQEVTTAPLSITVGLKTAVAPSSSVDARGSHQSLESLAFADMGPTMNEPIAGPTFDAAAPQTSFGSSSTYTLIALGDAPSAGTSSPSPPASPGQPKTPVSMPCSITTGAHGTGSVHGPALADLPARQAAHAVPLRWMPPLSSSVLPKSLANDPGSWPA